MTQQTPSPVSKPIPNPSSLQQIDANNAHTDVHAHYQAYQMRQYAHEQTSSLQYMT